MQERTCGQDPEVSAENLDEIERAASESRIQGERDPVELEEGTGI